MPPSAGTYAGFVLEVRRYRLESVLRACADVGALLVRAEHGRGRPQAPNYVTPFALSAVAEAALTAGTEHRRAVADREAVGRLCGVFSEVDDPELDAGPDASLRGLLTRLAYQQFGFGGSHHDEAARAVGLLLDHAPKVAGAPDPGEWEQLLGVPLETYMRVVFAVFVAAVQNPAGVTRTMLRLDHVAPVFAPAGPDQAMAVIDRWLSAPVLEHRAWALERRVSGRELWSPSPLQHRPLVSVGDELIAPVPEHVLGRMTPAGLWFTGLDAFGSRFTDTLGGAFESYVGAQLALLGTGATVHPEAVYGSPQRKTVDWFVVTDQAVFLVEVKTARPVVAVRTGSDDGDRHVLDRIGRARGQIDRTAELIAGGHPAVAHIPSDRPVRGLVVTLEPFHLVDTFLFDGVLPPARTPTATASAHDVEAVCAALAGRPDAGRRLLDALTPMPPAPPALRRASEGLPPARNPLLDGWWRRWSG